MVEESIKLKSAFRGFGDEDDEGKGEEAPPDESLDDETLEEDAAGDEDAEF